MSTITRRRAAQSAAWAIPVIAIGVAAPEASASTVPTSVGTLIWDNNQPFFTDTHSITFNYGFRSDWTSKGPAVCTAVLTVDGKVVDTEHYTLNPNKASDKHEFHYAVKNAGLHQWAIVITAPGFNTLSANGSFTTKPVQ